MPRSDDGAEAQPIAFDVEQRRSTDDQAYGEASTFLNDLRSQVDTWRQLPEGAWGFMPETAPNKGRKAKIFGRPIHARIELMAIHHLGDQGKWAFRVYDPTLWSISSYDELLRHRPINPGAAGHLLP